MKVRTRIIAVIVLLFAAAACAVAQCSARSIVRKNKSRMAPYQYDSYALKEITFDPFKPQVVEIEFTAFAGYKYKLVFGTSDFAENINLNIYDKCLRSKKRNKLYDSKESEENNWAFEPEKPGTYYINYEVPRSISGVKKKACAIMMVGFKD